MTAHGTTTMAEARAARDKVRERENDLARLSGEIAQERRELPWVRIETQYTFDTGNGPTALAGLFDGRSQLLIYHIMFGPDWTAACPARPAPPWPTISTRCCPTCTPAASPWPAPHTRPWANSRPTSSGWAGGFPTSPRSQRLRLRLRRLLQRGAAA